MTEEQIRLLVVVGDAVLRDLIRLAFSRSTYGQKGYEVLSAVTLEDVLKIMVEKKPHGLIVDMLLPQMNGLELIKEMRSNDLIKDVPVIMLSSIAYREIVEQALQAGAADFLIKPFDVDELIMRVQFALKRAKVIG